MSRFNPRARAGRDLKLAKGDRVEYWFQSTRPRGARHFARVRGDAREGVSIHAPARGATCALPRVPSLRPGFNRRARAGRDDCTLTPLA